MPWNSYNIRNGVFNLGSLAPLANGGQRFPLLPALQSSIGQTAVTLSKRVLFLLFNLDLGIALAASSIGAQTATNTLSSKVTADGPVFV